jgi:hypothetical protein
MEKESPMGKGSLFIVLLQAGIDSSAVAFGYEPAVPPGICCIRLG